MLLLGLSLYSQSTCTNALAIIAGEQTVASVNGTQVPMPICTTNGTGATAGMWYIYIPTEDYTVTITTNLPQNEGKDTRFHVYVGTCDALECYAGNDDISSSNYLSEASFNVFAGVTYIIAFDNRWESSGFDFELIEEFIATETFDFTPFNTNLGGQFRIGVVDMNNDFLDDLVSVSNGEIRIQYQNIDGSFTPVTFSVATTPYLPSWSLAAGDIDGNGYNDLLYGGLNGVAFMIANEDGTAYELVSSNQYVFSQRSNFIDLNNDGHLDAFVCHDVQPNVYYINDGEGNLTFNQGGIGDFPTGGNYGSIWVDYDNDGFPDLFIAKCRGGSSNAKINELFKNNGDGTFTDVSVAAGMADPVQTWSSAWADFDNDGFMDTFVGANTFTDGHHKLMYNNGDGTFTDITVGSGFEEYTNTGIEFVAHDFDNDGFVDVFGAGNTIYFNNGDLTFTPVQVAATNGPIGDLNNDGFLDVLNGNTIYFNNTNANNWIKIQLQGVQSNRNGIGARVEIYGAWGKQIRDVRSGDGFRFMSSLNTHFGIGTATEIDQLIIRWPSGVVDVINNPSINQSIFVLESSTLSVADVVTSKMTISPNPASNLVIVTTDYMLPIQNITIFDLNGRKVLTPSLNQNSFEVQSLPVGTYIVLIEDIQGHQAVQKLIKK